MKKLIFTACLMPFFSLNVANADLVINVQEIGSDVRFDYSGELDLTGLAFTTGSGLGSFASLAAVTDGFQNTFPVAAPGVRGYFSPYSSTGGDWVSTTVNASSSGGDYLLFSNVGSFPLMLQAVDFAGGGDIWTGSGFLQFDGTTIADLPIDLSVDRVWTINNAAADTITITTSPIPEPSSFVCLLGVGLLAISSRRIRQPTALNQSFTNHVV